MEKLYGLLYRFGAWGWRLPNSVKLAFALADLAAWILAVAFIVHLIVY